ncbi:hypothetical protein FA378_27210 [Pseudomonas aeruginosa]|uniref:Uncharacterized protein n=1 Tax=Pseudomonas aeruginosa TaxID=287 RepID=A0A6B1YP82_PSEAI|nr:hypothetical protein [Pseudomonas aeruginosa]MCO2278189.1 hypothetical protein [Pseudomonas aeruginosa]MCO2762367.1 hypothetical protein [Pseudomonas aeruginosa]MCO2768103.1 hypothetical protein [Pseudomonas aeruginosa]MZZ16602.1 hypothetical protein [Pseudomonas aeruginosa]HBN9243680.1 hypothetical protein [Pseudomonas aeruginosa]
MDNVELLRKRLRSAKQRARYWAGVPNRSGFGYKPAGSSTYDADAEYEMALDDCAALADEIERITGKRPTTSDPKREFNAYFARSVLPKIAKAD